MSADWYPAYIIGSASLDFQLQVRLHSLWAFLKREKVALRGIEDELSLGGLTVGFARALWRLQRSLYFGWTSGRQKKESIDWM